MRHQNRALCHDCNANIKAVGIGKYICHKCHGSIDDGPLRFRGELYHGYHFNCTSCGVELDSTAREVKSRPGFAANDMVFYTFIFFHFLTILHLLEFMSSSDSYLKI